MDECRAFARAATAAGAQPILETYEGETHVFQVHAAAGKWLTPRAAAAQSSAGQICATALQELCGAPVVSAAPPQATVLRSKSGAAGLGLAMLFGGGMATALSVELISQVDTPACGVWSMSDQLASPCDPCDGARLAQRNRRSAWARQMRLRARKIPLRAHAVSAALVASSMALSNAALAASLPLPLHIVLKSAALPASAAAC